MSQNDEATGFLQRFLFSVKNFFKSLVLAIEGYLRGKTKFLPLNPPLKRREITNAILEQKKYQDTLHEFSRESGIALEDVEKTFRAYLHEISADLNYLAYPFWDTFLTWLFRTIYDGFEVDSKALEKIRPLIGNKSVVFAPNHRSHMDYLLLSYIFYNHKIQMPYICAGANLSFWPLGPIFRKSGGFFIRRSYEGNKLYALAVQAYVESLLRDKQVVEFFIEGGRSRTGKMLHPRMGILSTLVQSYLNGVTDDILIIPTTITYDSVLEEKNYIAEQAGELKNEEKWADLFRLQKYLRAREGKIYLNFGEPVSLKQSLEGASQEQKRAKVREVAYELTYGINKAAVATPSSLVAMAMLTHEGRSVPHRLLTEKVETYLDYLRFKQCHLSESLLQFQNTAIQQCLTHYAKKGLIQQYQDEEGLLYRVREDRRSLLDYYKNNSLHFFVSIGTFASILLASGTDDISLRTIEEDYAFLQNLLQYDFIYSRRQPLRMHLAKLVEYLEGTQLAKFCEPVLILSPGAREPLSRFSSLIRNYLEAYHLLWKSLPLLGQKRSEEKELVRLLQQRGFVLFLKEEMKQPESPGLFTLKNALASFRDLGLLKCEKEGWGKRLKNYYTVISQGEETGKKLGSFLVSEH